MSGSGTVAWAAAGLLAVAVPLSAAAAGPGRLPGDVTVTRIVQEQAPSLTTPAIDLLNLLGTAPFMFTIACAIAAGLALGGRWRDATLVGVASLAQLGNWVLKQGFASPRPDSSLVRVTEHAGGFGFPSGHVMGVTVLAGVVIAIVVRRVAASRPRAAVVAGIALVPFLMGVARVHSGAHWPSDALGAWLWGALVALALVSAPLPERRPVWRRARAGQMGATGAD